MDPDGTSAADDMVTTAIGMAARADAELEQTATIVWVSLAAGSPFAWAAPRGLLPKLDGLRAVIEHGSWTWSEDLTASVIEVLDACRRAHDLRNTAAHSRWAVNEDGSHWTPVQIHPGRPVKPAWDLAKFDDCVRQLRRVNHRLNAVAMLAQPEPGLSASPPAWTQPFVVALLRDEFVLAPDGSARIEWSH